MDNMTTTTESPSNGHLGAAWEIAIVVVFVFVIFALTATAVFQMRKKQKRKQQRALNRSLDIERGRSGKASTRNSTVIHEEKCTERPHSRGSIINDGGTCVASVNAKANRGSVELTPPSPTAQPKRLSKSSYHEYISKKPPKYYWDLTR